MPEQVQLSVPESSAAPLDYTVPNAQLVALLAVNAVFDGTSATGAYYPTLELISDSGHTVARCIPNSTVAAGSSAEITFAPFLRGAASSTGSAAVREARWDLLSTQRGFVTETFSIRESGGGRATNTSGLLFLEPIALLSGETLTGVTVWHALAGTSVSLYKYGLYPSDMASLLAATANSTGAATSAGWQTIPFTATYTASADEVLYAAQLCVNTSSSPQFMCGGPGSGAGSVADEPLGDKVYYTLAGQTDLPSSINKAGLGTPPVTVQLRHWQLY